MKFSKIKFKALSAFAGAVSLGLLSTGCSPVNQANDHLSGMDQSTQVLTQSVTEDQKYLKALAEQMEAMQGHMSNLETELASDREYVKTMTECMQSLSTSIGGMQKMSESALHIVMDALLKPDTPPPPTSNGDDLFKPKPKS